MCLYKFVNMYTHESYFFKVIYGLLKKRTLMLEYYSLPTCCWFTKQSCSSARQWTSSCFTHTHKYIHIWKDYDSCSNTILGTLLVVGKYMCRVNTKDMYSKYPHTPIANTLSIPRSISLNFALYFLLSLSLFRRQKNNVFLY